MMHGQKNIKLVIY